MAGLWDCPVCGRRVPLRAAECYCGTRRPQAPAVSSGTSPWAMLGWAASGVLLAGLFVLLGSPGSRNDVWDSYEFRKIAPKLGNVAKNVVLPPSPPMDAWHHPANGRFAEHEPILLNEWVKVSLGQMEVEKYAQDVGKQIQDILDKPPV